LNHKIERYRDYYNNHEEIIIHSSERWGKFC